MSKKRGLINLVGNIIKGAFGTLDENDAEYYNNAINKVNSNEKHLLDLLKQQVQVAKSTLTNFNNTITNFNHNKVIFNDNLNKLSQFMSELKQ